MSWFHTVGGQYHITDKWVGIDFANSFMEEKEITQSITIHEWAHVHNSENDFLQDARTIIQIMPQLAYIDEVSREKILSKIVTTQWKTQEGFASLMQVMSLTLTKGRSFALKWAEETMPDTYKEAFEPLKFILFRGAI